MCLGDFNEILTSEEKVGGVPRPQTCMDSFQEALVYGALSDIGFTGDKFTWRNHSQTVDEYICERLDRAVANAQWCDFFPDFSVTNGDPRHSDHRPVIVCTESPAKEMHGGDGGFRFEAWWLQEEGCSKEIKEAWEESWMNGEGSVAGATGNVDARMSRWQREVVGELEGKLKKSST